MTSATRIFYFAPDGDVPIGGVKMVYRHVDILNENGFQAWVLHSKAGTRCSWFSNSTRVGYVPAVTLGPNDVVVLPEVYGHYYQRDLRLGSVESRIRQLLGSKRDKHWVAELVTSPAKKVIFNQNAYLTFTGYTFEDTGPVTPYTHQDTIGVMVVSEDNSNYLQSVFPDISIERIHYSLPPIFSYSKEKDLLIAFMPRKNSEHALQVVAQLRLSEVGRRFKIIQIDGMNEVEVADTLRRSLFFLSFGYPEGFSLPPAEAMTCGAMVVGYHGNGGREYFDETRCFPVRFGDITGFVDAIKQAVFLYDTDRVQFEAMTAKASKFVSREYSAAREVEDVITIWNRFLKRV